MKYLLLTTIIHSFFRESVSINGLIWSKAKQEFIPIFDISTFRDFRDEVLKKESGQIQAAHRRDCQGQNFRVNTYELGVTNLLDVTDNATKISGWQGDIWNVLSETLNFTIEPILESTRGLGDRLPNGTYTKILGRISRNEVDIVPFTTLENPGRDVMRMTTPTGTTGYRFYIRKREIYDGLWMVKVFAWKVWLAVGVTHLFLTLCGFLLQKRLNINVKVDSNLLEHYFYNFAAICNQGFVPINFRGRSRLFEVTLSVFAHLLSMAFSALLVTYLTQKIFQPPFDDIDTMLSKSDYDLAIIENSGTHVYVKDTVNVPPVAKQGRYTLAHTVDDACKLACSAEKRYAMVMSDNAKKSMGEHVCKLNQVGRPLIQVHRTAGIRKDLVCAESIDLKISRMREVGLLQLLYQRWVEVHDVEDSEPSRPEAITMEQVSILFVILISGASLSIVIFIVETIIFHRELARKRRAIQTWQFLP